MATEILPRVLQPDRGGPAAIAAVTIYAALPWIAAMAYAASAGHFEWGDLFIASVAVGLILPAMFVAVAELPRRRWLSTAVWFAGTSLVPFAALAIAARNVSSDPQPLGSMIVSFAAAWAVLLASALGFGALCIVTEPAFRSLAGRGPLRRADAVQESWWKAFVAGMASCALVGPAVWVIWRDGAATAAVSAFVVGLNVLAWVLRRCSAEQVCKWVVVLAIPAVVALLAGPTINALWILVVGLAFAAALGVLCSRSIAVAAD